MSRAVILRPRVCREIESLTEKLLRELGPPEPPLRLEDVRHLLKLDRSYFTSEEDGLLRSMASRLKRGGKQILNRPTLLIEAVRKFDLRAIYLPDHKRILIDETIPWLKHRWLEAHEIAHDLLPWHGDMMLGDDDLTPTASTHDKMEAEANYAAGNLLFLGGRFREECLQVEPTIANARQFRKRYGNSITTTIWRMIEYTGEYCAILGAIGAHPREENQSPPVRHLIPSRFFDRHFPTPAPDRLMSWIRSYCHHSQRGPLGRGEVHISDRWGQRHLFNFETFYNGYDAITMGVCQCEIPKAVVV